MGGPGRLLALSGDSGMSEERKKPVWPWIATLLIGLLVLYVVLFGPAC